MKSVACFQTRPRGKASAKHDKSSASSIKVPTSLDSSSHSNPSPPAVVPRLGVASPGSSDSGGHDKTRSRYSAPSRINVPTDFPGNDIDIKMKGILDDVEKPREPVSPTIPAPSPAPSKEPVQPTVSVPTPSPAPFREPVRPTVSVPTPTGQKDPVRPGASEPSPEGPKVPVRSTASLPTPVGLKDPVRSTLSVPNPKDAGNTSGSQSKTSGTPSSNIVPPSPKDQSSKSSVETSHKSASKNAKEDEKSCEASKSKIPWCICQ